MPKPPVTDPGQYGPSPRWSRRLYARIDRCEIAYVRFIIEAYDNLALMSVVDKYAAVICLRFAAGQEKEVRHVLEGLSAAVRLEVIDLPELFPARSTKYCEQEEPRPK